MKEFWAKGEADLEELLGDEVMAPVVRSAGLSRDDLRRQLTETARKLRADEHDDTSGYRADFWELRGIR